MSTRAFDMRPRLLNGMLLPVLFALALAAGVIAGDRSGSFFVGLLAYLVAWGAGRVLRRLTGGRLVDAVHEALWPACATGFAILYISPLGLAKWLDVILAMLTAIVAKRALVASFLPSRKSGIRFLRDGEWSLPSLDDVIEGRWTRTDDES